MIKRREYARSDLIVATTTHRDIKGQVKGCPVNNIIRRYLRMKREYYEEKCDNDAVDAFAMVIEDESSPVIVTGDARIEIAKLILEGTSLKKQVAIWGKAEQILLRDVYMKRNVVAVKSNNVTAPDSDRVDLYVDLTSSEITSCFSESKAKSIIITPEVNFSMIKTAIENKLKTNVFLVQTYDRLGKAMVGNVGVITLNEAGLNIATL